MKQAAEAKAKAALAAVTIELKDSRKRMADATTKCRLWPNVHADERPVLRRRCSATQGRTSTVVGYAQPIRHTGQLEHRCAAVQAAGAAQRLLPSVTPVAEPIATLWLQRGKRPTVRRKPPRWSFTGS